MATKTAKRERVRDKTRVPLSSTLQQEVASMAKERGTTNNEMLESLLKLGIAAQAAIESRLFPDFVGDSEASNC